MVYTLENVTEDHTISFTCEAVPEDAMDDDCVVTLIQPKYGGTITVENPDIVVGEDGTFTVPAGTTVNFTFTPEPGFANRYYVFDNTWYSEKVIEVGKPVTYTRLTEIHGNHRVTAEFYDDKWSVEIDPNFEYIRVDFNKAIESINLPFALASLDDKNLIYPLNMSIEAGDSIPVRKGDDLNLAIGNHYDRETEIMYIPYEIQLDGEKVSDFSPTPFESYYSYWTLKDVSEAHTVSIKYKDASQGGTEEPDEPSGGDDNSKPSGGSGGSSGGSAGSSTTYTAKVNKTGSGSAAVSPQNAKKGDKVTVTATPNAGYEVAAVTVTDSSGKTVAVSNEGNGKYTFTQPGSRVAIQVTFRNTTEQPGDTVPFTDVASSEWYYEAVQYVYNNELMNGMSATTFEPNSTTTRGMIVTMLYRLENEPTAASAGFTDVAAGQWYTDAVNWAAANNIVNGYGDDQFGPTDTITREQMAAILYRYAQYKGYDVTASADLSAYTDAANISSYAVSAMQWAVSEGLINGITDTTLVPGGSATRAQVAAILMRFCENVAK